MIKLYFQDIHYSRRKANFIMVALLYFAEIFYKSVLIIKNLLYDIGLLKEKKADIYTICVGNLTTGGVGKTPIVKHLANSTDKKICIISRGYGAKISNKNVNVIKDFNKVCFDDGTLCGDEVFQLAKSVGDNVMVLTCADRFKAAQHAKNCGCEVAILDDGFSNRKLKKDETILAIDSKMRFGNNHLLPAGPLREPLSQIKRADCIYLVNKDDSNIDDAISWVKQFNKPYKICSMVPKRIYDIKKGADVDPNGCAIAFCAIGQQTQFFNFAKKYYELSDTISFEDHHMYTKNDINMLTDRANKYNVNTFITTQKDEAKLKSLIPEGFNFNVLELECKID